MFMLITCPVVAANKEVVEVGAGFPRGGERYGGGGYE